MVSLDVQIYMFFVLTLTGIGVGIAYDFFRAFRRTFRVGKELAGLSDILFWLVATLLAVAGLLLGNWGEIRLYVFLALALGLYIYFQLASFLFLDVFSRGFRFWDDLLGRVLKFLVAVGRRASGAARSAGRGVAAGGRRLAGTPGGLLKLLKAAPGKAAGIPGKVIGLPGQLLGRLLGSRQGPKPPAA